MAGNGVTCGRPSDRTVEIQNNSAPSMVCSTRSQGVADAFGSLKRASSSAAGIAVVIAHLLRHQYGTPGPVPHHVGVGHAMRSATPSTSATASAADSRTDAPRGTGRGGRRGQTPRFGSPDKAVTRLTTPYLFGTWRSICPDARWCGRQRSVDG